MAKAMAMWLVLLVAMFVNGTVRVLVLQPRLGEHLARQLAVLTGILIILGLTLPFVRSLHRPTARQLLGVGLLWLALTVAFEFSFGRYVLGTSWEVLLADYDLLRGRLWPLALLVTATAPWLCSRFRR
jgi:threonine/homoserine efflux transporter RhtA